MDDGCVESVTPVNEVLSAKYKKTFAYKTVTVLLPARIDKIINDLQQNNDVIQKYGKEGRHDLVSAIIGLTLLKAEIVNNVALVPFISPAEDEPIWNKYLWQKYLIHGEIAKWLSSEWLFVECYMYRRIQQIFESSYVLKFYDPFRVQKENLLESKLAELTMLADYTVQIIKLSTEKKNSWSHFIQFLKIALWGNHCDLSRPIHNSVDDISKPLQNLNELDRYIIVDDSEEVWKMLNTSEMDNKVVDFVNDNAGYELFCDLCLADFLCASGLAKKIHFHVKIMPWFISDATVNDFSWLLHVIAQNSQMSPSFSTLSKRWKNNLDSEAWILKTENFWTLPHAYCEMKNWDKNLYQQLSESSLIIFKGDLNYRKLLAEKNWPSTEVFSKALQGFHPTNLIALRTVKSELICGMKCQEAENLSARVPDWMLSGDYAVIQFDRHKSNKQNINY